MIFAALHAKDFTVCEINKNESAVLSSALHGRQLPLTCFYLGGTDNEMAESIETRQQLAFDPRDPVRSDLRSAGQKRLFLLGSFRRSISGEYSTGLYCSEARRRIRQVSPVDPFDQCGAFRLVCI